MGGPFMITAVKWTLLTGIASSLLLILFSYPEWGGFALILTPIFRNFLYGCYSLYTHAFLFSSFAFFTLLIILFT